MIILKGVLQNHQITDDGATLLLLFCKKYVDRSGCSPDLGKAPDFWHTLINLYELRRFPYAAFTGNRWLCVLSPCIFACSLFMLYPIQRSSISSFTLVFPLRRNLWKP